MNTIGDTVGMAVLPASVSFALHLSYAPLLLSYPASYVLKALSATAHYSCFDDEVLLFVTVHMPSRAANTSLPTA